MKSQRPISANYDSKRGLLNRFRAYWESEKEHTLARWIVFIGVTLSLTYPIHASAVHVSNARIPESAPGTQMMAAYMTLANTTTKDQVIVGFSSPVFKKIEMHQSSVDAKGMARMRPVSQLVIKPNQRIRLKPNSYHLMLFHPVQHLKVGQLIAITAHFKSKKDMRFDAVVEKRELINGLDHSKHHH